MNEKWTEYRLGDLGDIVTGRTPPSSHPEYFGDEFPFITPSDMTEQKRALTTDRYLSASGAELLKRNLLPAGSVAVSCIGWQMGKAIMTVRPSFTNQQLNTIIPNELVESDFLYYTLTTWRDRLLSLGAATGVRTPILNKTAFSDLEIRIPPLPTQRKIAAVLSAYDDLIENNTRRIAVLEEMAQRLYREWFVEYRFPGHESVPLVEVDGFGPVPEGWEVVKLGDVANVYRGCSYRSKDLVEEGGFPFLNLKCIDRDGGFRIDGIKRYDGRYKDTQTAESGDIVMAVTDMTQARRVVARAARVPDLGMQNFIYSMDLVKIVADEEIGNDYLYGMLRFSHFSDEVKQYANGANVLHLNPQHISDFAFALPPKSVRNKFAALGADMNRQSDILTRKNTTLRQTRDLLLPRLISGAVDVSALEIDPGNAEISLHR